MNKEELKQLSEKILDYRAKHNLSAEKFAERLRKETAREIYKKAKESDDNFERTSLGEYIMANFLSENGVEVEE